MLLTAVLSHMLSVIQAPSEVMGMTFDGCIGDVEMDGRPIGLFNFRHLVQSHNCQGCVAVYVTVPLFTTTYTHTCSYMLVPVQLCLICLYVVVYSCTFRTFSQSDRFHICNLYVTLYVNEGLTYFLFLS